jgi:hypothetical protein
MFTELRFSSPSVGIRTPSEARGWASKTLPSLPRVAFNHQDRSSGPSPYCVTVSGGSVLIDGVGRVASAEILRLAPVLQSEFLAAQPNGEFAFRCGSVGVSIQSYLREGVVHDFVLQNANRRKFLWRDWREDYRQDELNKIAGDLFMERLAQRAELAGVELPEDLVVGDFHAIPCKRPIFAAGHSMPKFAVELRYRTNAHFIGPWRVGQLSNKGAGRIRNVRKPADTRAGNQVAAGAFRPEGEADEVV